MQWLQPFSCESYSFWQVLSLLLLLRLRTVSNQFADPAFIYNTFLSHNRTSSQNTFNIVIAIHYDSMSSCFAQNKLLGWNYALSSYVDHIVFGNILRLFHIFWSYNYMVNSFVSCYFSISKLIYPINEISWILSWYLSYEN